MMSHLGRGESKMSETQRLLETIGFDPVKSKHALEVAKGNIDAAIEW